MATPENGAWWRGTRGLAAAALCLWLLIGVVLPLVAAGRGGKPVFGFPAGSFLALVAVPVALAVLLFVVARRQAAADRRHDEGA